MKNSGEKKILTRHPEGKAGVRIDLAKYNMIKDAIIKILTKRKMITFEELAEEVVALVEKRFQGSVLWYYTTVKLDLEARKVIRRIPGSKPQQITLNKKR
jgi:dihydroneopterin aldolase